MKKSPWPFHDATRPHPSHTEPIVARARFMVTCDCGFAHDSAQPTAEAAVQEIATTHRCDVNQFTAEAYP